MSVTRRWLLTFDTLAPASARARVLAALGRRVDDAELVASELVGNAIRHGHPPVELEVTVSATQLHIAVSSTHGPGDPTPVERAHGDGTGGAGLRLVAACTTAWAWELTGARLIVRAEVPIT